MTKQELRKHIKEIQKPFFEDSLYRIHKSYEISSKIISSFEFKNAENVFCFMPLSDEVNIISVMTESFLNNKKVAVPRITDKNGKMEFICITLNSKFQKGEFSISEPENTEKPVDMKTVLGKSLLLVPGRAFTKDGKRLGRGKGFYDLFLSEYKNLFYKMGVCFPFQIVKDLPVETNDMPVDSVIV